MPAKIAVFMGTRPEAIKMAPVVARLNERANLQALVINSGQHREMIQQVIDLFGLPVDAELDVMVPNQTLATLTARLIERIDKVLAELTPAAVLVQGDTTTVFAATLASFYHRIPVGHVEAGLRTGNIASPFPEEANRRLTSPLVRWHYSPTERSQRALLAEGVPAEQILVTGNTVIDALLWELKRQEQPLVQVEIAERLHRAIGCDVTQHDFILVTGHRRENFGEGFEQICTALAQLARDFPQVLIVYPVHLNPNVREVVHGRLGDLENIKLIDPQPYSEFLALAARSRLILTDSGGVQEEAPSLGKPVLVMRDTTERPEGVEAGSVRLVGTNVDQITSEVAKLLTDAAAYQAMASVSNPYGDGHAAERIACHLSDVFA